MFRLLVIPIASVSMLVVLLSGWGAERAAPPESSVAEWPAYGRDPGGSRSSPLAQITRDSVTRLQAAWTYRTGDVSDATAVSRGRKVAAPSAFEATPILVDGTLYLCTPFSRVIALDPETGRPCADFGRDGQVDLTRGVGPVRPGDYQVTSPPAVIGDLVIVGSAITDNQRGGIEFRTLPTVHAKVILIDDSIVYCGSANWYRYSLEEGQEMVLRGPVQAVPSLLDELASLWDQGRSEDLKGQPVKRSEQTATADGYGEELLDPIAAAKLAEVPGAFVLRRKPRSVR